MLGNVSFVPNYNISRKYYVNAVLTVSSCALLFFTVVVGIASNLFVAWAVKNQKSLQTSSNALLVNLAVIDFLRCVIDCPLILAIFLKGDTVDQLGFSLCNAQFISFSITCCVQLLTLASISADRFLAIAHPFQIKERRARVMIWIPMTWTLAILSSFLCLMFVKDSPIFVRCKGLDVQTLASYDTFGLYFLTPLWAVCLAVIVGFYGRIFIVVKAHTRKIFDKGTVLAASKEDKPKITTVIEEQEHAIKEIVKIVPEMSVKNDANTSPCGDPVLTQTVSSELTSDRHDIGAQNTSNNQDKNLHSTHQHTPSQAETLVLEDIEKHENCSGDSPQNLLPDIADGEPTEVTQQADAQATVSPPEAETQGEDAGAVCMMPPRFNADRAKKNKEGKLAKRSSYIIFTFLAFWTPFIVTVLINHLLRNPNDITMEIGLEIEILTVSLVCMTSVTNPIIYAVVNPQFRTEFHNLKSKVRPTCGVDRV